MATDYDAPRMVDVADVAEYAIESLKQNQVTSKAGLATTLMRSSSVSIFPMPTDRGRPHHSDSAAPSRRVHMQQMLPGAPPQPARKRRMHPLLELRRLNPI